MSDEPTNYGSPTAMSWQASIVVPRQLLYGFADQENMLETSRCGTEVAIPSAHRTAELYTHVQTDRDAHDENRTQPPLICVSDPSIHPSIHSFSFFFPHVSTHPHSNRFVCVRKNNRMPTIQTKSTTRPFQAGHKRKRSKTNPAARVVTTTTSTSTTSNDDKDEISPKQPNVWKPVPVTFSSAPELDFNHYDDDDDDSVVDDDDDDDNNNKQEKSCQKPKATGKKSNSYRRIHHADDDLEAQPGEQVGLFFGLEVISADQYTVEQHVDGTKHFCILADTSSFKKQQEQPQVDKTKERKRSKRNDQEEPANPPQEESQESSAAKKKKNKEETSSTKDEEDKQAVQQPKRNGSNSAHATGEGTTTAKREGPNAAPDTDAGVLVDNEKQPQQDEEEKVIQALQTSWMTATGGVQLHPTLCRALWQQDFWIPTPIQAAVLPTALLGGQGGTNIVGAAPTGSGKTLAYLVPIGQYLLEQQDEQERRQCQEDDPDDDNDDDRPTPKLQALILAPTRELALQIHNECHKLLSSSSSSSANDNSNKNKTKKKRACWIGTIVGGLAVAKQTRILNKLRPPILVGTPGRLWELVRGKLKDMLVRQSMKVNGACVILGVTI